MIPQPGAAPFPNGLRSVVPATLSLFVDFANAIFQPFSIFAMGGCHPIAHFVFSVRKTLAMLSVFAILLPLVSALLRRRLDNSRYSRDWDLNVGLPWWCALGMCHSLRDDIREQQRGKCSEVDLHAPLNPLF